MIAGNDDELTCSSAIGVAETAAAAIRATRAVKEVENRMVKEPKRSEE